MKSKVTGVGGIFFKAKNPKELTNWYAQNLGFNTNEWGSTFAFRLNENPDKTGYLQWSPFAENTSYFEPSEKQFMINFRVENLEVLLEELKENGVEIIGELQVFEYGKFAHILDNEGNKIELWEPIDEQLNP